MGELHLEIIVDRLVREFKVSPNVGTPQVAYKETITCTAEGEGQFQAPSGGKEQYGHVVLHFTPAARGTGVTFDNKVDIKQIPELYLKTIEKSVRDSLDSGPLIGYPLTDVTVQLVGGSYDEEHSTEMAFAVATALACRKAATEAEAVLLEPVMEVEVIVPEEYLGEVINDLNRKNAHIEAVEAERNLQVVRAKVPLAQMFGYSTTL
jgi:elongation factor G